MAVLGVFGSIAAAALAKLIEGVCVGICITNSQDRVSSLMIICLIEGAHSNNFLIDTGNTQSAGNSNRHGALQFEDVVLR